MALSSRWTPKKTRSRQKSFVDCFAWPPATPQSSDDTQQRFLSLRFICAQVKRFSLGTHQAIFIRRAALAHNKRIIRQHGCAGIACWTRAAQVEIKLSQINKLRISVYVS